MPQLSQALTFHVYSKNITVFTRDPVTTAIILYIVVIIQATTIITIADQY